ncbi:MAG: cobalt-precorrin-5B (C(1))-methyltransferase CbiD [Proteobacteria bacterium]|nr:cobalt-precorrin-5B (C(1))-methyltransferase CbiD [Pseudomonadota bacterium]MBU1417404.1 cobalt-precorrin-5B (C(1))-methyltransferase CbiD [Pseudomonadota bacterium]MBU1453127.1 cobalt-precorrin-5B (C(1))-methyltransferase CbiD [Pseudomonadota bacterium]
MKKLRSGYTTGACAAAAAKAAALLLLSGTKQDSVEIPFPDGSRVRFSLVSSDFAGSGKSAAQAAVIKDAGDDPDVTNGARIEASVCYGENDTKRGALLRILGGVGVGTVTKRGLAVQVGEPAINPVPRKMIRDAVSEALVEGKTNQDCCLDITISIPQGEELAEKTLNHRLGIVGGLSVLGTTGIVRPISADAWTATITASMDVARAAGLTDVILSTGRTSERAVQEHLGLPEEAQVMMGDYLHFALQEAARHNFHRIHLAAMWAKVMKGGMKIPQTHVRNGALEIKAALEFLGDLGCSPELLQTLDGSNTAREIYGRLLEQGENQVILSVCEAARIYCQEVSGLDVIVYLVDASSTIVATTEREV